MLYTDGSATNAKCELYTYVLPSIIAGVESANEFGLVNTGLVYAVYAGTILPSLSITY